MQIFINKVFYIIFIIVEKHIAFRLRSNILKTSCQLTVADISEQGRRVIAKHEKYYIDEGNDSFKAAQHRL